MRILYLADSYRPARSACANRTVVLVDALRAAGHDVQVLASSDSLLGVLERYAAPDYVTFFETFPLHEKTLLNRLRNNFGGSRASVEAARHMGDFDVVVVTTPPLLLLSSAIKIARDKGAKLVWDVRDVWPDVAYEMGSFGPHSPYGLFFSHVARKGYRTADLVTSVSVGKVAKLRERMPRGREGRVALVPNGIDAGFCQTGDDANLAARLGLNDGHKTCVYVGNIGLAQGLGTLLAIAADRRDVRFLLFGEGADKAKLMSRAAEEGLDNVEFCGTVDARGVRTVLSSADLSYVPLVSSRLRDSVPTKLYEALACGCPVLLAAAPDGDAAALVAECGLGGSAAPEDQTALKSAFDCLVDAQWNPVQREAASRYVLEKHSRQVFAREFAALVSSMGSAR